MIVAECNNEDRCIRVQILGTDVDGSYVTMRRETFTIPHPEFGFDVPIGLSVHQYRDRYSADGTLIETLEYGYNDEYYLHEEAYADRLAAARAAAEMGGGGEGDEG